MSLLLISQAYSQLDESFSDENEEISTQDVHPVAKCSVKSIKKLVGVEQASSRKYELRKRRLVRSSNDLKIRKGFALKSKTISKRSCKPSSKRNVKPKLDTNSTNQSKNTPNAPDLYSRSWPFNHLKLVLNFKSEANSSPKKKVSLSTADNWRREWEMFVYYDTLTSADKKRLERMKEGYYSCSELESEGELEELDDQESEQVAGSNLDESLYSHFTPVKEQKKISKPVGINAIKHRENFEDQTVSFPVTRNQKRVADLNKAEIHENEKYERRQNSDFEDILTKLKNERKQKPVIGKIAVIKLERCDNLVQKSRTTIALGETLNKENTKKRNCKVEEKAFKCTECSKKFSKPCHLRTHGQVHIGRKPFKCPTCPKAFLWQKNLRAHIKAFHLKNGEEKTKCPICYKIFSSIYNLKAHREVVHFKLKPFQCSICSKQFSAKSNLKDHERCHTKEKPFECPACKKRFTGKINLSRHQRTHNATKPLKCSISSKGFTRKNNPREHKKKIIKLN